MTEIKLNTRGKPGGQYRRNEGSVCSRISIASLKNATCVSAPAFQLALRAQTGRLMAPHSGAFLAHRLRVEIKTERAARLR